MEKTLVTGAAGFIGYHVASALLDRGVAVVGIDNLSDYYDVALKRARLERLSGREGFSFQVCDVADRANMEDLFRRESPSVVVHLAAQAGVRYSLVNPHAYGSSNLTGFLQVLENCRHSRVRHLVFASSSSVYGDSPKVPHSVGDPADYPISLYAATKKANEEMAHSYSHLYGLPTTGLRFFTVYGPWGRPDMAYFSFTKAIVERRPIELYNFGEVRRDFTYVDDVVSLVVRVAESPPAAGEAPSAAFTSAPYALYNLGNHSPVSVGRIVDILEDALGRKAERRLVPAQPGDVTETYADVDELMRTFGFAPSTPVEAGLRRFVDWYTSYYGV